MVVEIIIASVLSAVGFSALFTSGVQVFINRQNREIEKRTSSALSPAMRDEIEQTPAWWDRQFHKLLMQSTGVVTHTTNPRMDYYRGFSREVHDTWLEGCICRPCKTYSRMDIERAKELDNDAKFELDNLRTILERERKMRERQVAPQRVMPRNDRVGPLARSAYEEYRDNGGKFALPLWSDGGVSDEFRGVFHALRDPKNQDVVRRMLTDQSN